MSRAGTGARDQVARLLTLVPLLHGRDGLNVAEAATMLGATPAQVVKDLKVLLMCGLPGGMPDDLIDVDLDALEEADGEAVIHVSNADYLSRPVRLSATEATALVVALRAVRDTSPEDSREVVDRVIAKLEIAAAEGSGHQVEISPESATTSPVRARLEEALDSGRQARIVYWVPSRDEVGERVIDPLQLANQDGVDYLQAWCHRAKDRRVFRLDRIQSVAVLDSPVEQQPDPRETLSVTLFTAAPDAVKVTLHLQPAARWVPEYYPVEAVRHLDDGTLEVDILVVDVRWLHQLVLRLAPSATVVSPATVSNSVLQAASSALSLYN